MEEGIPVVDGNAAADAKLRRFRCQFTCQRHEIEFIAARTM